MQRRRYRRHAQLCLRRVGIGVVEHQAAAVQRAGTEDLARVQVRQRRVVDRDRCVSGRDDDVLQLGRDHRIARRQVGAVLDEPSMRVSRVLAGRRHEREVGPGPVWRCDVAGALVDRDAGSGRRESLPRDGLPIDRALRVEHARRERSRRRVRGQPDPVDDDVAAYRVEIACRDRPHQRADRRRVRCDRNAVDRVVQTAWHPIDAIAVRRAEISGAQVRLHAQPAVVRARVEPAAVLRTEEGEWRAQSIGRQARMLERIAGERREELQ